MRASERPSTGFNKEALARARMKELDTHEP
jgi:hypothetical protein